MYYYYDVLLNFGDDKDLFEFYEWEEKDTIEFVKKIPVFRVKTENLKDFFKYQVKFSNELVEQIKGKTLLKSSSNTIEYAMLLSDSKNAIALELNKEGVVISRSKLLPGDDLNLMEVVYTMKENDLTYEKRNKYSKKDSLRQVEEIKKIVKCEIDVLYKEKNYSKLKYLYYEWFNKTQSDIEKIYKDMTIALNKEYNTQLKNIYDFIKMSYNNVN